MIFFVKQQSHHEATLHKTPYTHQLLTILSNVHMLQIHKHIHQSWKLWKLIPTELNPSDETTCLGLGTFDMFRWYKYDIIGMIVLLLVTTAVAAAVATTTIAAGGGSSRRSYRREIVKCLLQFLRGNVGDLSERIVE